MSLAVAHSDHEGHASLPIDRDGFLVDSRLWNRDMGQQMADRIGVGELGETQWLVVDFLRDRYFRLGAMPPMRQVCRRLGVDRDVVKKSFGGCRELWQIAGLPHPGDEALSYMD